MKIFKKFSSKTNFKSQNDETVETKSETPNETSNHKDDETAEAKNSQADAERIINLIIVDESGSMGDIYWEALNGMNDTIEKIKSRANEVEGVRQYVNLITFDSSHYKQHLRHCPAEKARKLSPKEYRPGACTPLYDAIGRAVTRLERHITDNDAVLVTIITDGYENASREYSAAEIKRLTERLTEKGWIFTYIGANQDATLEAGKLGIRMSLDFVADSDGTNAMWEKDMAARENYFMRMKTRKMAGKTISEAKMMDLEEGVDFYNS